MKAFFKNRALISLLLFGLFIRLILAFLPGFKIDVNDWFAWVLHLSTFDYSRFYSPDFFSDYNPGYLYILSILGYLKNLLSLTDNSFYLILKLPAIISDLLICILIYIGFNNFLSRKMLLLALSFFLFNPAVIFNSAVWGQIDSILTLLMLASVIFLKNKKLILSSALFGLALLVKPQALALIPLFVFFLVKNFAIKNILKLILPAFFVIFLLSFPFFPKDTLLSLTGHILKTAGGYPYTSVNAYNLWGLVGFWINDSQIWNSLSYNIWGYFLLTAYWLTIGYFYLKKKLSIYSLAALLGLAFFFLPTRVHERYLYPAIIFLILTAVINKSKLLLFLTGLLSLIHFFNLYYVYVYYNEIYFKMAKIFYNPILYNFLAENSRLMSITSLLIFILISISILKYNDPHKN